MARETEEVVTGVSHAIFDAHAHNYRKITTVGADSDIGYVSPTRVNVVDDSEVNTGETPAVRAIGVTVATLPTSIPV